MGGGHLPNRPWNEQTLGTWLIKLLGYLVFSAKCTCIFFSKIVSGSNQFTDNVCKKRLSCIVDKMRMTNFMPWHRDYVIKVTHNNTVYNTMDFLSSLITRFTVSQHEIHPESFVHDMTLPRFTGFNKIRFTDPRRLNNPASRVDKASVEALALDRAPLASRLASKVLGCFSSA